MCPPGAFGSTPRRRAADTCSMNELEQIVGRLDTPKQGPRRRPSRLQQLMHELDDRDQQGDPDLGAMRGRYARLHRTLPFLRWLALIITLAVFCLVAAVSFVSVVRLFVFSEGGGHR